jgi:hypothetical protein
MGNSAKDSCDLRNATEFLNMVTKKHKKTRGLEYYILETTAIPNDSLFTALANGI